MAGPIAFGRHGVIPSGRNGAYLEGKAHTLLRRVLNFESGRITVGRGRYGELGEIQIFTADTDLDGIHGFVDVRAEAKDVQPGVADF